MGEDSIYDKVATDHAVAFIKALKHTKEIWTVAKTLRVSSRCVRFRFGTVLQLWQKKDIGGKVNMCSCLNCINTVKIKA